MGWVRPVYTCILLYSNLKIYRVRCLYVGYLLAGSSLIYLSIIWSSSPVKRPRATSLNSSLWFKRCRIPMMFFSSQQPLNRAGLITEIQVPNGQVLKYLVWKVEVFQSLNWCCLFQSLNWCCLLCNLKTLLPAIRILHIPMWGCFWTRHCRRNYWGIVRCQVTLVWMWKHSCCGTRIWLYLCRNRTRPAVRKQLKSPWSWIMGLQKNGLTDNLIPWFMSFESSWFFFFFLGLASISYRATLLVSMWTSFRDHWAWGRWG